MNILVLGNGYDINFDLLTSYRNFLLTTQYLCSQKIQDINTVGEVFRAEVLQKQDKKIVESYQMHKVVYDDTPLDKEKIQRLVELARTNIWFSYLLKSFNKDIGWIDFEKEISKVIYFFNNFLKTTSPKFSAVKTFLSKEDQYIITDAFGFFILPKELSGLSSGYYKVRPEYITETPIGSGYEIINKEKIIDNLVASLNELSEMLKLYMQCFVENTLQRFKVAKRITQIQAFYTVDTVVTFNYTNTFEQLSPEINVIHIHGDLSNNIVLGINPDGNDVVDTANTDFIQFKKYYQRVFYETDHLYLSLISQLKESNRTQHDKVIVMGHSLDVTDKDILAELFELADEIKIIYHRKAKVGEYIANLVRMFGKETFDEWRLKKGLEFIPLEMNPEQQKKVSENKEKELLVALKDCYSGHAIEII